VNARSEKREASSGSPGRHRLLASRFSVLGCACLLGLTTSLSAQANPDLQQSRQRLDSIRQERSRLEREQQRLAGQVTDAGAALRNLERQRDAQNRLVNEIERQIGGLTSELDRSAAELTLAQDNLADRKAVLQRRLADIYKRGPLYTFQVLLTAESFGDLLSRYKWLYLTSRQDRALLDEVEQLNAKVKAKRDELLGVRTQLDRSRAEREAEMQRYAQLAEERQGQLKELQQTSNANKQRLTVLERDEARLNDLLASLSRANASARGANATPSAGGLSTSDIGRLDWPVEGRILYQFGRDTLASGAVIRWNGIGIAAPIGTPVKSVGAGRVALVSRLSTYGLTVIVEHGNDYYSLYMQLETAAVKLNQQVTRGQIIGTVGGENSEQGPHLHFEIRGKDQIALDPVVWLKQGGN
jgi:septal ring factor EnvC (AmiA/AmiB activator)